MAKFNRIGHPKMRLLVVSFLSFWSATRGQDLDFISPTRQDTTEIGPYAADSRWPLGSTQAVAFSTPWTEYRVEFWQQELAGGSARQSSHLVYNQTAGEVLPQSFQWIVSTYEFDLSHSPVFFFWLFDYNSDSQQSSAYFNITTEDTSSTTISSSTTLAPSSTSTVSSITTASTTTSNDISGVHTSEISMPTSSETADTSEGLSTGAKAGVGVGAALGGLLVFGIAGLLYLKRTRSRGQWQQHAELQASQPAKHFTGYPEAVVPTSQYTPKIAEAPSHNSPPFELGG
ncbi:hypothetical protein F5Y09DRAFT_316944 [Xylaria sp. FL1042]|nr:hypothetical protein F5Y09DRAFT_316944 [Xylaria sp. FL1042]